MSKRPYRVAFFDRIVAEINVHSARDGRVLELGSGPGFLAQHLLEARDHIEYVMLDFSPAMHQLAETRLDRLWCRVEPISRDFRASNWTDGLGFFDCVVTMQAVHELRHKRRARELHTQVRRILASGGIYLMCDHFAGPDGMANDRLFMSTEEQRDALHSAGFTEVEQIMLEGSLALYRASR